jgi:hypothetical protein
MAVVFVVTTFFAGSSIACADGGGGCGGDTDKVFNTDPNGSIARTARRSSEAAEKR